MVLFLYKAVITLVSPFIYVFLLSRLIKGKEDKKRYKERFFGVTGKKRPAGKLVWMHGASVGECLSMMPLIKKILEEDKNAHVMVTSGTVTSAELMAKRLPERAFHQFIPVDFPWSAARFVKHWKPDVALWFESDFWPNMLGAAHKAGVPLILLNGRISDKSFRRYSRIKWYAKPVQDLFTMSFGQSAEDAERLKKMGAAHVVSVGNLKFSAVCPPFDAGELKKICGQIGGRPCWCAASTHPGEEEIIAKVHGEIKKMYKDFLTVSVPRHPVRANEIEKIYKDAGLTVARRSRGEKIEAGTDVYLADTIGEMGLLYQLAPLVFVGGSLIVFGGQNMLEPMRLHRVVFVGPHTFNFKEIIAKGKRENALIEVKDQTELIGNLVHYIRYPEEQEPIADRAEAMAMSEMTVLDRVYRVLQKEAGFK